MKSMKKLAGMNCPECSSRGPFLIQILAWALVSDQRVEEYDVEEHHGGKWNEQSPCFCTMCGKKGLAGETFGWKPKTKETERK